MNNSRSFIVFVYCMLIFAQSLSSFTENKAIKQKETEFVAYGKFIGENAENEKNITLSLDKTPLKEVIPIFAEMLNFAYNVDPKVKGNVSLSINKKLKNREIWKIFQQVLISNNCIVNVNSKLVSILPVKPDLIYTGQGNKPLTKETPLPKFLLKSIKDPDKKYSGKVTLELKKTPLKEAVSMFADFLGFSYKVSPEVKGFVTLSLDAKVTPKELWKVFDKVIQLNGAYISVENKVVFIRKNK